MTLPNFLIIGAAKAATTSLYHYLRQHPDVFMSRIKEPAYYAAEGSIRSRADYERLFEGVRSERAIGEASPQYLNDPSAPDGIAADLEDVRLIVSLRHPVDRAYSSYLGRVAGGTERRTVEEAMRLGTYYFRSSLYYEPLSRYLNRFARSQIKIVLFDDVVADTRAVIRGVCDFLDVDRTFAFDASAKHGAALTARSVPLNALFMRGVHAARRVLPAAMRDTGLAGRTQQLLLRKPAPLPTVIREQLLAGFEGDILQTEELIGRSLSHWLE